MKSFKVGARLALLTLISSALLILTGVLGLKEHASTLNEFKSLYENRLIKLDYVADIGVTLKVGVIGVLDAFHYDPSLPESAAIIDRHVKEIEEGMQFVQEKWRDFSKKPANSEEMEIAASFDNALADYEEILLKPAVQSLKDKNYSRESIYAYQLEQARITEPLNNWLIELAVLQGAEARKAYDQELLKYERARWQSILVIIAGILGSILGAWLIIRSVTKPLTNMRNAMIHAEKNADLTQTVRILHQDEIGETTEAFNQLQSALRQTMRELLASIHQVSTSANDLVKNAEDSSLSATNTNESASSMAAAVEEMTVSIQHVGNSSKEALELAKEAGQFSIQGGEVIQKTVAEINKIADVSQDVSSAISQLSERSKSISSVIQVIKEVADQTNLLALNAAIEAARAGESGRGFAVVADEVRKLAERTTKATGEISLMISDIQGSAHEAVEVMARAAQIVNSGVALANNAGEAILKIRDSANNVVLVVSNISDALVEQATVSNDISQQVEEVSRAAEQNHVTSDESAQSARNLEKLAENMRASADRFQI